MFKPSILAAFVIAAPVMTAMPAFAQDQDADTVVATVNGEEVTLGQMILMRQSMNDPSVTELPAQELWDLMLDQLVRQSAVASQGEANAGVRAEIELQRRNTLATLAVTRIAEGEVADDEVQAAYDRLFASAEPTVEYSAAHILVETEDEAKEIKQLLDDGGDFGALAEERSTDNSGANKGDLGWFAAEQMVEPFANAVRELENGQISDPVESQFGWHIIKLNDNRNREAPALDEVREEIEQMVRREKVEAGIEQIVGDATIEKTEGIPPELLGNVDLLEAE